MVVLDASIILESRLDTPLPNYQWKMDTIWRSILIESVRIFLELIWCRTYYCRSHFVEHFFCQINFVELIDVHIFVKHLFFGLIDVVHISVEHIFCRIN